MNADITAIARAFTHSNIPIEIQPFGSGNINDTFLVCQESSIKPPFILQRINAKVFPQPERVMQNIRISTEHMNSRLQQNPLQRRWEVPYLLFTETGQDRYIDAEGSFWRAMSFIENSRSFDTLENSERAAEVGYALGTFHRLISDLPPETLTDTLPGFHITPNYLETYEKIKAKASIHSNPEIKYCSQFIADRQSGVRILEDAKERGVLPTRLMHGDPKINNVLFDTTTEKAVSLIDLDTLKPGLIQYDIGDCLRSACNRTGEETNNWESVYFDVDLCYSILQGYLSIAKSFLCENDIAYFYDSIRLISFELGVRFFSDYLAGNLYFKVQYPEQNLSRAIVQFKLTESIEAREASILKAIETLAKT